MTRRSPRRLVVRAAVAVLVCVQVAPLATSRAQHQTMPLLLVEGNRYERESSDAAGQRTARQTIEVGRLRSSGDELDVVVTVRDFDADGASSDSTQTTIRCRLDDADMVMNVLALLGPDARQVQVRITSGELRYPAEPTDGRLAPIVLDARLERGALGFFRGRSRIELRDRTVSDIQQSFSPATNTYASTYTVTSRLEVRTYVLGVRVRSNSYRSVETIALGRGLVRQALTAPDGSSVALTLMQ